VGGEGGMCVCVDVCVCVLCLKALPEAVVWGASSVCVCMCKNRKFGI